MLEVHPNSNSNSDSNPNLNPAGWACSKYFSFVGVREDSGDKPTCSELCRAKLADGQRQRRERFAAEVARAKTGGAG